MSTEKSANTDVYHFMKILDEIILLGRKKIERRKMLKREEYKPLVDEPQNFMLRTEENDRVFPMDTVELQGFNTKHNKEVGTAILHTGPYADELARSMNALAVTYGYDIFFRHGAYSNSTEQGRAILSHELTHIEQYENKQIKESTDINELEKEAELSESKEYYNIDPIVPMRVGKKIFRVRKSKLPEIAQKSACKLLLWLEEQKVVRDPIKYLSLLCKVQEYRGQRI